MSGNVYNEYNDLILGKDWCWDRYGVMIPDTYNPYGVHEWAATCATNIWKTGHHENAMNFLEVSPMVEDYEVDDAIIIHLDWVNHWGHWLFDGLAKLWPLFDKDRPSDNIMILYTVLPSFFPEEYKKYLINQNQFIVPKRVKHAYIPKKTYGNDGVAQFGSCPFTTVQEIAAKGQTAFHLKEPLGKAIISTDKNHVITTQWFGDLHRTPPTQIHKKVFLSRGGYNTYDQRIPRIFDLEDVLEKTGQWSIIRMHEHSIGEQLNILENADIISGSLGSAFHGLLMTRHFKGKVIYLVEEHDLPMQFNYDRQNELMDLDYQFKRIGLLNDDELEEITKYLMEVE